jgi:sensor histidine kinase YesM
MQPLVENAFRHGIARRTDDSLLRISAAAEDGAVRVTIYNDGPPLPEAFTIEHVRGYGLRNVTDRLRTRDPAGRLELANGVSGVRATLLLPRWSEDANARQ